MRSSSLLFNVSWGSALLVVSTAGCRAEDERAPTLTPSGEFDNPVSCDALREAAPEPNETGGFFVSGGLADCVSDGQWCAADWASGICDGGVGFAQCRAGAWVFTCQALGEAGGDGA